MTRNPYTEAIAAWDWKACHAEAVANAEPDDDDGLIGLSFLGSVFALYPSGKFYTPWACGNVEACPACKGRGDHPPKGPKRITRKKRKQLQRIRVKLRAIPGFWLIPWLERAKLPIVKKAHRLERETRARECHRCGGLGSEEAHKDALFAEALEEAAEAAGMFITAGEGDPCDVFAGVSLELEEAAD